MDTFEPKVELFNLPGKNRMFSYTANSKPEAFSYYAAMREIDRTHNLGLFHQIGSDQDIGFHGWEIWKSLENAPSLEFLCRRAENIARGFFMKYYAEWYK